MYHPGVTTRLKFPIIALQVEQRGWLIAAIDLALKLPDVVLQTLLLISTLAACKHEVVSEAMCGAGLVNAVATKLVVPFENRSIYHQHVFSILKGIVESLPASAEEKLLDGNLAAWVLTSSKSVPEHSSAGAHLREFAAFLQNSPQGTRYERIYFSLCLSLFFSPSFSNGSSFLNSLSHSFTRNNSAWPEFAEELLRVRKERVPDSEVVKGLLALKAKPLGTQPA